MEDHLYRLRISSWSINKRGRHRKFMCPIGWFLKKIYFAFNFFLYCVTFIVFNPNVIQNNNFTQTGNPKYPLLMLTGNRSKIFMTFDHVFAYGGNLCLNYFQMETISIKEWSHTQTRNHIGVSCYCWYGCRWKLHIPINNVWMFCAI
jgi:hypothetical protein